MKIIRFVSFSFVKKKKKCLNYIGADAGERKTDEKEKAARGVGAAATAIAVAGTVLRPRERVNFHDEHGGDEEQPEGRGVEPRLWRQAQRYYTRAYQHLPRCDALLHRSGRVYSAQVRRLVLCGYVLKQISLSPRHSSVFVFHP